MAEVRGPPQIAVSAGASHSLFLKTDSSVWGAGNNSGAQLGGGPPAGSLTPVRTLTGVAAISAGNSHSFFVKPDGVVLAAGYNKYGQLGDGRQFSPSAPVQVLTGVQSISADFSFSLFLRDGTILATGLNGFGQFGDGTTSNRMVPMPVMTGVRDMSAGDLHSLFLKTDKSAWATGANFSGQLGFPRAYRSTPVEVILLNAVPPVDWQKEQFGTDAGNPEIAGWMADPDGDSVVNLLERAFNLPPLQADTPVMAPNDVTAGLPWITAVLKPEGPVLTVHYLRLKTSGGSNLVYTPEFSSNLKDSNAWMTPTGPETVESIDSNWERVTVSDANISSGAPRFARVRVTLSP